MSQRVFGKPAKNLSLAESALDRRPGPRAGGAVAVVEPRRSAIARSHVVLARMREERFITAAQEQRGARARRSACVPYRSDSDAPPRLCEGVPAAALPRRVRRRSSARLAGRHDVRRRAAGRRRSARSRTGLQRARASRRCRRRWSPSIPRPATCWRWSAAATISGRPSIAPAAAGASRARRSSRSCSRRRSSAACRRSRSLHGLNQHRSRRARTSGRRATSTTMRPDELTLRAALIESNNRAATLLQQQVGTRRVLRLASRRRPARICPTCRRWRSAPGW